MLDKIIDIFGNSQKLADKIGVKPYTITRLKDKDLQSHPLWPKIKRALRARQKRLERLFKEIIE